MLQDVTVTQIVVGFIVILAFIVLIVAAYLFLIKKGRRRIYKAKGPYLLSTGETKFFEALAKVVDPDLYVCPKVRIADLVEVNIPETSKDFWRNFGKISQKHIDFVICKRADFSPLLVIELDGGSHNERRQIQRDELVNKVFMDAEIPILHIKPRSFYDYKLLREEVLDTIKN